MKKKKVLSAFLALAMATSLFSACTDKNKSSEAETSASDSATSSASEPAIKEATISMLVADNVNYPFKADWMALQKIKEKTGITIDPLLIPEAEYTNKRTTMFADPTSMPDLISQYFPTSEEVASGILLPISDYEDKMPNFKKFIEDNGLRETLDNKRAADGKYYYIPSKAHKEIYKAQQWLIRTDIFEKNNIKVPTTMDEIYDAGVKLKALYPDSAPITNRYGGDNILTGFAAAFGTNAGWCYSDGMHFDTKSNTWEFAPITDKYKNMAIYINKLIKDGVLDKEWGTLDGTVYEQKIVEGQTFMMYDWSQNIVRYNKQGKEKDPNFNVSPIYPPKGPNGDSAIAWEDAWAQGVAVTAKTADKPYFEDVLRYIDWCFTDEAEMLLTFGVEGETYKVRDDGVVDYLDRDNVKYDAQYGLDTNYLTFRQHADSFYSAFNTEQVALMKKIIADKCIPPVNPASPLTNEQIDSVSLELGEARDLVNQELANFYKDGVTDAKWSAFVKKLEPTAKKVEKLYNDQWAKRS